jgi:uncharacterized repeat protein (TIGR01451 family)
MPVRTRRSRIAQGLGSIATSLALSLSAVAVLPAPAGADPGSSLTGSPYNGSDGILDAGVPSFADNLPPLPDTLAGGVKEDDDCPSLDGGSPAPKNDLTSGYVAHASGTVSPGVSHTFLYLGWRRATTNGTTTIDFELNQGGSSCPGGTFVERSVGDLLFNYDFHGGAVDGISLRKWTPAGVWSDPPSALGSGTFEARISGDQYFGELVVDLHALGFFPADVCKILPTAMVKTRSSAGSDANQLKDIVLPFTVNVSNCGRVDVHKQEDGGGPLSDVVFVLHSDGGQAPGSPVTPAQSCTTDADGDCSIVDIKPGTYWVVESQAPAGHTGAAPRRVVVGRDDNDPANPLVFVNDRKPATVNIVKRDDAGAALAGATFGLYDDNAGARGSAVSGKACTTDAAGTCSIDGILPAGTYWLHETGVPAGHSAAADQKVTLALNQTVSLTFVDPRKPATVKIVKRDDTGAALAGATFGLYTDDGGLGSPVAGKSCATDAGGDCSIGGILPPGTYWLHETVVPAGYSAAADQKVTLALAETVTLTFVDRRKPATVNIVKRDDAGAALAGATFGLYADDGGARGSAVSGKSCTTDAGGDCSIGGILPPATYWLHETGVPAGHTAAADQQVTLGLDQTVTVTFQNDRIPAAVDIVKRDDAGAALAGATFGLYADDGGARGSAVPAKSCTTNGSGLCSIDGILPPGTYWLHETAVPAGYDAAADQKVTLGLDQRVTLTFVDNRIPGSIDIVKRDDAGAALAGASFGLYADDDGSRGSAIEGKTCTTNGNGNCSITGILPGTYWLHETAVPAGYGAAADKKVTVALATKATVNLVDPRLPVHVSLHKVDDTGDTVEGAAFALYANGEGGPGAAMGGSAPNTGRCTTDAAGDCTLHAVVSPGNYWLVETDVPAGYFAAEPQSLSLVPGQSVDGESTPVFVDPRRPSSIAIDKRVNGEDTSSGQPLVVEKGTTLTYTVTVTNTGGLPLTIADLVDNLHADLAGSCTQGLGSVLALEAHFSCTYTAVAKAGSIDSVIDNAASVTGEDRFGRTPSAEDHAYVHVLDPVIDIVKTGPAAAHVGDSLAYTLAVTNPGNTPLSDVTVVDPKCAGSPTLVTADDNGLLSPGEAWLYRCNHPVVDGDGDKVTNTATASGTDVLDTTVSDTASVSTVILRPAINVTKAGPETAHVGDAVVFTLTVTNPGNTGLSAVSVTDPRCAQTPVRTSTDSDDVLSPGETWIYRCTHVATADDGSFIVNTAKAAGTDTLGSTVTSTGTHTTALLHPAISLSKSADPLAVAGPDGSVTYTYVVTNTGDTMLSDVWILDDLLGPISHLGSLAPGESVTFRKLVTVTGSTPITNMGTASGTDALGQTVSASATATITIVLAEVLQRPTPTLPVTGGPIRTEVGIGMGSLALGLVLSALGRRRRGQLLT